MKQLRPAGLLAAGLAAVVTCAVTAVGPAQAATGSGWRLVLHPDGTTTAYGPDGQVLHSHSPPTLRAG